MPRDLPARVRGLQTHKAKVEQALPGSRVAVNLAGLAVDDLRRGDVLAPPGALRPSQRVDVRLRLLADAPAPLAQNDQVDFFVGAAELPAWVDPARPRAAAAGRDRLGPAPVSAAARRPQGATASSSVGRRRAARSAAARSSTPPPSATAASGPRCWMRWRRSPPVAPTRSCSSGSRSGRSTCGPCATSRPPGFRPPRSTPPSSNSSPRAMPACSPVAAPARRDPATTSSPPPPGRRSCEQHDRDGRRLPRRQPAPAGHAEGGTQEPAAAGRLAATLRRGAGNGRPRGRRRRRRGDGPPAAVRDPARRSAAGDRRPLPGRARRNTLRAAGPAEFGVDADTLGALVDLGRGGQGRRRRASSRPRRWRRSSAPSAS